MYCNKTWMLHKKQYTFLSPEMVTNYNFLSDEPTMDVQRSLLHGMDYWPKTFFDS